jgi:hypothetical protein
MRQNLSNRPSTHNTIISEKTIAAIIEKYLSLHGTCTEQRLMAVVKAASHAAASLVCFQMIMRGDLNPNLKNSEVFFRNAPPGSSAMESCGDITRRVLKEVGI